MTQEYRKTIDSQINYIIERHGTPIKVYISIDVLKDMLKENYPDGIMLEGHSNIVWRGSCAEVPIHVINDKKDYVMVEDYLDVIAEQELLGED